MARLGARLRDRGTVLLVQGPWPLAEATLDVAEPQWSGVGRGHGYLADRTVTVTVSSRRWPRPRRQRMLLPGAGGEVAVAPETRGEPAVTPMRKVVPAQPVQPVLPGPRHRGQPQEELLEAVG
jgi:hypothetical protein